MSRKASQFSRKEKIHRTIFHFYHWNRKLMVQKNRNLASNFESSLNSNSNLSASKNLISFIVVPLKNAIFLLTILWGEINLIVHQDRGSPKSPWNVLLNAEILKIQSFFLDILTLKMSTKTHPIASQLNNWMRLKVLFLHGLENTDNTRTPIDIVKMCYSRYSNSCFYTTDINFLRWSCKSNFRTCRGDLDWKIIASDLPSFKVLFMRKIQWKLVFRKKHRAQNSFLSRKLQAWFSTWNFQSKPSVFFKRGIRLTKVFISIFASKLEYSGIFEYAIVFDLSRKSKPFIKVSERLTSIMKLAFRRIHSQKHNSLGVLSEKILESLSWYSKNFKKLWLFGLTRFWNSFSQWISVYLHAWKNQSLVFFQV